MKTPIAIYVHIPFCKARCGYCAFSSCADFSLREKYFDVLCKEIANTYIPKGTQIKTMFWGGGTPSSVGVKYLQKLYKALSEKFDLSHLQEFTVECNPESASLEVLQYLKRIGVNRISFGLQSVNDATLKRIGRLHTYGGFLQALATAQSCGFSNINADLILGLPESISDFYHTVETVAKLPLTHVSLYALEIHPENQAFVKLCKEYPHSDDQLADAYDKARAILEDNGFMRYEVSNFAKFDKECLHNCVYWTENRYFGFGAAASGFVGHVRYGNAFDIKQYVSGAGEEYNEVISESEEMSEYAMLGLRLSEGILLSDFAARYGCDFYVQFPNTHKLLEKGFLQRQGDALFVPSDKFYVLNSILVELLPD